MTKKTLLTVSVIFIYTLLYAADTTITVYHINDTHGRLINSGLGQPDNYAPARISYIVMSDRQTNDNIILLHAGDILSRGDVLTRHTSGSMNIDLMNRIGYSALTPGNGEFYTGHDLLLELKDQAEFPFLSANVTRRSDNELLLKPYIIFTNEGIRLAVLGLSFIRTNHPSAAALELTDPVNTARKYLPQLKEKADILIVLSHLGLDADNHLAREVPGLDIIIGGHSHNRLTSPLALTNSESGTVTWIAHAGDYHQYLGRLLLQVSKKDGRAELKDLSGSLLPLLPDDERDLVIQELIENRSKELDTIVCRIDETIPLEKGKTRLEKKLSRILSSSISSDFTAISIGTFQAGLEKGPLKVSDIYRIHPWQNRLLTAAVGPKEIRKLLKLKGLVFTGLEQKKDTIKINDKKLKRNGKYVMLFNDYMLMKYPELKRLEYKDSGKFIDEILLDFFKI